MAYLEIKHVIGLIEALEIRALSEDIVRQDLEGLNVSEFRQGIDVYNKEQVNSLVVGSNKVRKFKTFSIFENSSGWQSLDKAFVSDDGDEKWAVYMATKDTSGVSVSYESAEFVKISDEDAIGNALSATTVLEALERNGDGINSIVGMKLSERNKLAFLKNLTSDANMGNIEVNTNSIVTLNETLTGIDDIFNAINETVNGFQKVVDDFVSEPNENTTNIESNTGRIESLESDFSDMPSISLTSDLENDGDDGENPFINKNDIDIGNAALEFENGLA